MQLLGRMLGTLRYLQAHPLGTFPGLLRRLHSQSKRATSPAATPAVLPDQCGWQRHSACRARGTALELSSTTAGCTADAGVQHTSHLRAPRAVLCMLRCAPAAALLRQILARGWRSLPDLPWRVHTATWLARSAAAGVLSHQQPRHDKASVWYVGCWVDGLASTHPPLVLL